MDVDTKNVDVDSDLGDELATDTDAQPEVKADIKAEAPKAKAASPDLENDETPLKSEVKPVDSGKQFGTKEIAALRRLERQQGRDRMLSKLNSIAKEKGFDDLDGLLNSIQPKAQATEEAPKKVSEKAQLSEQLDSYKALASKQEKMIRRLKDQLADLEMSTKLEKQAMEADVADVDYAVSLLRRKAGSMSEEEAKSFDPKSYFASLKEEKPWLFRGEAKKAEPKKEPATTGPTKADKSVKTEKLDKEAASESNVDVRKMSKKEYEEYLSKNGLRNPRNMV